MAFKFAYRYLKECEFMGYKDEICSKLKQNINSAGEYFTLTIGKDYAVVEGHKGVISFDGSCVKVKLNRGSVTFKGERLEIASSQIKELIIKGHSDEIAFEGVK